MILTGNLVRSGIRIDFSARGERGHWTISTIGPGTGKCERECADFQPYRLLSEMLDAAYEVADHGGRLVGGGTIR